MHKLLTIATVTLAMSTQVSAAPISLQETFGVFGAVTQNFTGNSESEGRVIVQGDVTGTIQVNDRVSGDNGDGFDDLIITGSVIGGSVKVGNSGNLTVGGDIINSGLQLNGAVQTATLGGTRTGGNFNQNEDILIENATSLNIPEVSFSAYAAEQAALGGLAATGISTNDSGQTVFGGSSVVSATVADLSSGTGVFDLTGLDTLVINVYGAGGNIGINFVDFGGVSKLDAAQSVVWNFLDATDLTFGTSLFGHVVATQAEVTLNSSNEGTVIANSLIVNNGELHPLDFTGTVPVGATAPIDSISPVPLPAGMLLLLTGFGVLGGARAMRRR